MNWALRERFSTCLTAIFRSFRRLSAFHPNTILGGNDADLVVHPSNVAICERLNGMANSTMRRHLSNLVQTGMIVRRDSPNGKRYARRYGDEKIAFGIHLTPLVIRHAEICQASEAVREARERYKRLRETASLMRRDLAGLAAFCAGTRPHLSVWDAFDDLATLTARDLRRKLDMEELVAIETSLSTALNAARNILEPSKSQDMSTNESISEQHNQNSNSDSYDFEPSFEKARDEAVVPDDQANEIDESAQPPESRLPNIPLGYGFGCV